MSLLKYLSHWLGNATLSFPFPEIVKTGKTFFRENSVKYKAHCGHRPSARKGYKNILSTNKTQELYRTLFSQICSR